MAFWGCVCAPPPAVCAASAAPHEARAIASRGRSGRQSLGQHRDPSRLRASFVECLVDEFEHRSDHDLLRCSAYEPEAFGAFYRRHVGAVLGFFRRRTGDAQLALDLTAETFARALEHVGSFRPLAEPPAAWLYTIARNLLTDSYRRAQVADDARRRLALEPMIITEVGFERVEAAADAARQLGAVDLRGALSGDQHEAVHARVLHGESYEQIAAQLRCSPQVARQHVSRGLRNLRRRWEKQA